MLPKRILKGTDTKDGIVLCFICIACIADEDNTGFLLGKLVCRSNTICTTKRKCIEMVSQSKRSTHCWSTGEM